MAFNTKLELNNAKFYQATGDTLSLCGSTNVGTIQYLTDQSGSYTARSITDAGYVTGKTNTLQQEINSLSGATIGSITGGTNGLTKTGRNIGLGGSLTGDTCIMTNGNTLAFRNNTGNTYVCVSEHVVDISAVDGNIQEDINFAPEFSSLTIGIADTALSHDVNMYLTPSDYCIEVNLNSCCVGMCITSGMTIGSTNPAFKGAQYAADYNANFTARSLIDKGYLSSVTGETNVTATNGLNKNSGGAIGLGGVLTGNTIIGIAGHNLLITGGTNFGLDILSNQASLGDYNYDSLHYIAVTDSNIDMFQLYGGQKAGIFATNAAVTICQANTGNTIGGEVLLQNGNITMISCDSTDRGQISVANKQIRICGSSGFIGAEYCADYSTNFTARSLVDKGYVLGAITGGTGISKAVNGLTKSGNAVKLGGTLTGSTIINDTRGTPLGIEYGGDYRSTLNNCSLIPKQYADACDTAKFNAATGFTQTCASNCTITASNGLTKTLQNITLGGSLIQTTLLTGSQLFGVNATTVNLTGATVNLGGCVAIKTTPSGSGTLLCRNASTGEIVLTSLSAFGGVTGGTNGVTDCGNQRLGLGGALCGDTIINGCKLTLGKLKGIDIITSGTTDIMIDAQKCGAVYLKSQSGTTTGSNFNDAVGIYADYDAPVGFQIYDNRIGTGATGIVYNADYSLNYKSRSLVDKGYVDSVATGLNVHAAAWVATTAPINLTTIGLGIIDSVTATTGMRILVKNQADAKQNGIYSASTGTWGRTADYDNSPSGEITNGDLVPVTSGSTQNNSLWAMVSPNPITVGVTDINFSLFSTTIDVIAGAGIAISMVGGVHTVCVALGADSGLNTTNGLVVDTSIAGNGLGMASGVINVNAANCGSVGAIPVGYNAGDCLVVACADLISATGGLTGATNGLYVANKHVRLGGAVCSATTLTINNGSCLTFVDSNPTPHGVVYGADYGAGFVARSLVDAQYVTGKTSQAILTANNGLTKTGTVVGLGGSLTGDTHIDIASHNLLITGGTTFGLDVRPDEVSLGNYNGGGPSYNYIAFTTSGFDLLQQDSGNTMNSEICGNASLLALNHYHSGITGSVICQDDLGICMKVSDTISTCNIFFIGKTGITICGSASFEGAKYDQDYSANYQCLSIPHVGWVTGQTSNILVCNGLTNYAGVIGLGGILTGETHIGLNGSNLSFTGGTTEFGICVTPYNSVCIGDCNGSNYYIQNLDSIQMYQQDSGNTCFSSISICENTMLLEHCDCTSHVQSDVAFCNSAVYLASRNTNANVSCIEVGAGVLNICGAKTGATGFQGARYAANYRANFACNSLVDAAYVTGKTTASSINNEIIFNNNGSLSGNTGLLFCHTCTSFKHGTYGCADGNNAAVLNGAQAHGGYSFAAVQGQANCYNSIAMGALAASNGTGAIAIGNMTTTANGLCSLALNGGTTDGDYSIAMGYSANACADNSIAMAAGITCSGAECSVAMAVGIAVGATSVAMAGGRTETNAKCSVAMAGGSVQDNACNAIAMSGAFAWCNWSFAAGQYSCARSVNSAVLGGNANILSSGNTNSVILGGSGYTMAANTYPNTVAVSNLVIFKTPTAGSTSDSVLVWNSSDKKVKTVTGSALGDKNNIYAKTTIAVSTTLTTGSTYVILVNPVSGTTITLPATPIDGQAFKIKDISGNALTNNITIDAGAGKQIDNAQTGSINTDFGALEIMYNSATSKWYSLAFVN